ncbi:MAG: hypothetical protein ACK4FY_02980 [Aquificaceae bacterium]
MRKSLLAVAALMGASVLPAKAAMFKVDEDTFANIGVYSQIWAQNLGKSDNVNLNNNRSRTNFSINNVKVYASGQVNKMVKFHVELDSALGTGHDPVQGYQRIGDAHITFAFAPEFNLIAGYQRLPYGRTTLVSGYATLTPTGYVYGRVAGGAPAFGAATIGAAGVGGYGSKDAGLSIMSNIMDGMIVLRAGIFDGRYDSRVTDQANENLAYAVRVQFTPTMLGYKGETGYSLSDTYLGKQNVLTLGVGYNTQKNKLDGNTWKGLTADLQWEQKFGDLVPNIQIGLNDIKDHNAAMCDARAYWVQGQLLYDQVVGFGKPALALGWYYSESRPVGGGPKPRVNRYAVYFNYYIKGQAAKIQLGADSFQRNSTDKGATGNNYTDFTLALQTQF